jgi:hypothetical protein
MVVQPVNRTPAIGISGLLVVLRTTPRENAKKRPAWYSKDLAFLSLLSAIDNAENAGHNVRLSVLTDGGVPDSISSNRTPATEVVPVTEGTSRGSMLASFRAARARLTNNEDLIWFAEDDYLYRPDALQKLLACASSTPATYFSLHKPDDSGWHAGHSSQPLGSVQRVTFNRRSPGHAAEEWRRITHTNSTFGVRASAFLEDLRFMRLATMGGGPYDHSTFMMIQGRRPFPVSKICADLNFRPEAAQATKALARIPARALIDASALLMRRRNRLLIAPIEDQVCHMEDGHIPDIPDWEALASNMRNSAS